MSWYPSSSRRDWRESGEFYERAFRRRGLADWDAKWHTLTPQARSAFADTVKGPARNQADHAPTYTVAKDRFPPEVLDELIAAGFVRLLPARSRNATERVFAPADLYDFATRVRMLGRLHLLGAGRADELRPYVEQAFDGYRLNAVLDDVLRGAGMGPYIRLEAALKNYVTSRRWPAWVSMALKDPLADRLVKALDEAGGPIPLVELPERVAEADPDKVRLAADKLIARLVLFEDLDAHTCEIVVDFLPSVREGLERSRRPQVRPPLVVCERPAEVATDDGPIVGDLRAFLLEVAAEPPRLRQDQELFQKEVGRFQAGLEPLPKWLMELLHWSDQNRLERAHAWARTLAFVEEVVEGSHVRLRLTTRGQRWLASGLDAQHAEVYRLVNALPSRDGHYLPYWRLFSTGSGSYYGGPLDDSCFLGEEILALKLSKGKKAIPNYWEAKPEDTRALRAALDRSLASLEPGVFYRLDSIGPHLAYGEHNPVHLGLAMEEVAVNRNRQSVPPLEELREDAGRELIQTFVSARLIPLGCVRAAIDAEGRACVARGPRLDAYFGREVAASETSPPADAAAKVVVQPDFSVIIVGLNPIAAAELAPFCERSAAGRGSRGAVILKITRDSVVRAVANGLEPKEIVGRLRRHASHEVPANVLHEVRGWSGWVRRVAAETLAVIRCPDRETADRVMGALRNHAERLNDTLVAVDGKLAAAERAKLRAQGVIVDGSGEAPASKMGREW